MSSRVALALLILLFAAPIILASGLGVQSKNPAIAVSVGSVEEDTVTVFFTDPVGESRTLYIEAIAEPGCAKYRYEFHTGITIMLILKSTPQNGERIVCGEILDVSPLTPVSVHNASREVLIQAPVGARSEESQTPFVGWLLPFLLVALIVITGYIASNIRKYGR